MILVPHLFGAPSDMKQIRGLNLPIIEDVTHALGGSHLQGTLGSLGDCSITSLHALKVVTAGEGGLVSWKEDRGRESSQAGDHLSNINSALALSQLSRLDKIVTRRRLIAEVYENELAPHFQIGMRIQEEVNGKSTRFRFVVLLPNGVDVDLLRQLLLQGGIVTQRPVKKLLRNKQDTGGKAENVNAERVFNSAISLPIHAGISSRVARKVARRFVSSVEILQEAAGTSVDRS